MAKYQGRIVNILDVEKPSETFKKQTIVIEREHEQYNPLLAIEFQQKAIDKLQGFEVGDEVEVSTNEYSREWNGKYFTSITGWDIRYSTAARPQSNTLKTNKKNEPKEESFDSQDGLPF